MALWSLKVDWKSVVISIATISTAWSWRPWAMTNSSEATMAAPAPSEVGQHCSLVRGPVTLGELRICSRLYSSWNWEYLGGGRALGMGKR